MNGGFDQPTYGAIVVLLALTRQEAAALQAALVLDNVPGDGRLSELLHWARERPKYNVVIGSKELCR